VNPKLAHGHGAIQFYLVEFSDSGSMRVHCFMNRSSGHRVKLSSDILLHLGFIPIVHGQCENHLEGGGE